MYEATATDDDFFDPDKTDYSNTLLINVEEFIEEYEYAQDEYKKAKGDHDKIYWDGYLMALEKISGDILIDV